MTTSAKAQDFTNTIQSVETPQTNAPMYIIPQEQVDTSQIAPIPVIIMQPQEQTAVNVIETKEQETIHQQNTDDNKGEVFFYVPMAEPTVQPTFQLHMQVPIEENVETKANIESFVTENEVTNETEQQTLSTKAIKTENEAEATKEVTTSTTLEKDTTELYYSQPVALPYVYQEQYANFDQNTKEETKLEEASLARIKQLLNAEKTNNKDVTEKSNDIQSVKIDYQAEALYQSTASPVVNDIQKNTVQDKVNLEVLEQLSGYGSKVSEQQKPSKLIDSTRNMVSGQDVLNINAIQFTATSEEFSTSTKYQEYVTSTTPVSVETQTEETVSLSEQPIVVEDETNEEQSLASTTATTSVEENVSSSESTVLVTPRPVSTQFLAPITAGVQLQSLEYNPHVKENVYVEIQKSVPYYLGKVEYLQTQESHNDKSSVSNNALVNIKDGNTLIKYNKEMIQEVSEVNKIVDDSNENCTETESSPSHQAPRYEKLIAERKPHENLLVDNVPLNQLSMQQLSTEEKEIIAAVANKEMEDMSSQHYYVAMLPENKEKQLVDQISEQHVQIPVPVLEPHTKVHTQIIEKPVHVTQYVDRPYPVPVQVHVPVPYTVEKKVPVPVTVEKIVDRPVTVTKYVERPIHVPQPYVVEKVVEKHVEVPVEVTKYIDRPYEVQVPIPHPVPFPVEVALPPPIPNDKPYINKDNSVDKYEMRSPKPTRPNNHHHKPLFQQTEIPKYLDKIVNKPFPLHYVTDNKLQQYPPQYLYAPNYHPNVQCDQETSHSTHLYHTINPDDYIGLTPPKPPQKIRQEEGRIRQNRHARHEFGKNLRIEYGFMPPLIPSLEIDENGQPVERQE